MKQLSTLKKWGQKAAVATMAAVPTLAMANDNIGTTIAQSMSSFVTIVSAIGTAGISVVVTIVSFALGFSMIKKISAR